MLRWFDRRMLRALPLASTLLVMVLAAPAVAWAGVPTILTVGHVQHHATVTWALPAGTVTQNVEISDSPAVGSDGAFFSDHVKSSDAVTPAQTTYVSTAALDPGTYYVHVAGTVAGCDTCPTREWSQITPLAIPTSILPVVEGSGQVTGPGGLSCSGATCPASDVPPGPVTLTAVPAAGWLVLSWSIEGVDAADTCGIAHTSCTVTVAATRAATVTIRFTPALPTVLHAGVKAYACGHRVEVVSPTVRPQIDTGHPFLGTLTISLKLPSGRMLSRKLTLLTGYYSSPDFYKLKPAKTYTAVLKYSGDEWRPAKTWSKRVKLGRC
ncbi:MAG: hypothetical protein QOI71_1235 [Gaiellales bacterium]|nr:hypothetical protein [Gaiellales bacterium]